VNGRLPVLLQWLAQAKPDVVCLQERKAPDEKFALGETEKAGYGAAWIGQKGWNGVAMLTRRADPIVTRRGLLGEPDDQQSRYLEAAVQGVLIGCLYLPNGNQAPGSKFDYKLRWLQRLTDYAQDLLALDVPAVLAGDCNIMLTDLDVYKPERWLGEALFRPEVKQGFRALLDQGWTDALRHLHSDEKIYTLWYYFRNAWERNLGLRLGHFLPSPCLVEHLVIAEVDREVRCWEKTSDHAGVYRA